MAAPNVATGDLLRVRATAYIGGQTAVWGCDYRVASTAGVGLDLQAVADDWAGDMDVQLLPSLGNDVVVGNPIVELVSPVTGRVLQSTIGVSANPNGTGGADTIPKQAAVVVRKATGLAGPSNRGRMYWPFVPSAYLLSDGTMDPASSAALLAIAATVFGVRTVTVGANSNQMLPILVHRYTVPSVPTYQDILGFLGATKIGTQKKRGDYGKPNPPI